MGKLLTGPGCWGGMNDHGPTVIDPQPVSELVQSRTYGGNVPYDDYADRDTSPFLTRTPYQRRQAHRALRPGEDFDRFVLEQ